MEGRYMTASSDAELGYLCAARCWVRVCSRLPDLRFAGGPYGTPGRQLSRAVACRSCAFRPGRCDVRQVRPHVRGRQAGPAGRERAFDDQVSAGQLVALAAWPRQGGGADIPAVCPVLAWAAFGDAVLVLVRAGEA